MESKAFLKSPKRAYIFSRLPCTYSSNYKRTTGQLAIWLTINDCLRESRMIHKSSPADLAQKIVIAYFPYTERLSCPYTKTTICLIRSFKFIELWEIFWSPQRTLVATHIKALIYGLALKVNYTKNVRSFIKQTPKTGWTESFWATRATFIRVKGERRPYWQFNEPHIVLGLIMHAKTGQIQSDLFL